MNSTSPSGGENEEFTDGAEATDEKLLRLRAGWVLGKMEEMDSTWK